MSLSIAAPWPRRPTLLPSFVLLSPDDLDSLEETLELLSDPAAMASIRKSLRQADEGDLHDIPGDL